MTVEALRELLEPYGSRIRCAFLFGSFARGKSRENSDVDIAIDACDVDHLALGRDLSLALGREVDVVDLRKAGYVLLRKIVRDGKVIFQGVPGAAGRFYAYALSVFETDGPSFERMAQSHAKGILNAQ